MSRTVCVVEQASSLCQELCVWWNRLPACVKNCVCGGTGFQPVSRTVCVVEQASSLCQELCVWWNRLPACVKNCVCGTGFQPVSRTVCVEQASSLYQELCVWNRLPACVNWWNRLPACVNWWNRLPACVKNCVVEQASSLYQSPSNNNLSHWQDVIILVTGKMPVPQLIIYHWQDASSTINHISLARCQFHN
ncbi:MAG: hypothetical protein F6K53_06315 [Moorea sp. SIO4A1]|uniref:hypothetical protein n=1 Tax=Moorena sp. SIO4A1 TaxID=2607835 RepID=UPI00144FFC42|nr:hypothetical protein [Moorena sp. SIO4A1]NEQ57044.1 hypothetical protein [Moorena sp. SIO4A1]